MTTTPTPIQITGSPELWNWLHQTQISLAFTTYQTNRLFLIGHGSEGRLAIQERLFDKPMGLYADASASSAQTSQRLYMSTRYQIWCFDNHLAPDERYHDSDRLYVPSIAYTTGDLNVHDVVRVDAQAIASQEPDSESIVFINTDFSCLATTSHRYSFVPLWQPPFISKLVAEDRCHLNGLAVVNGQPAYVTACSTTDTAAGWRDCRNQGGVVMDVRSHTVITTGLSMPHSPRWYRDRLWLLNAGTGELGYVTPSGEFTPIAFCPGFLRGLAFWENIAIVGLSKLRSRSFTGLHLEERLSQQGQTSQCGLMLIDLTTGNVLHWLHLDGVVEELFDIVVLPGVTRPRALGFQSEDIQRLVNFPGSNGLVVTKPTVKRSERDPEIQIAGLPERPQPQPPPEIIRPDQSPPAASAFSLKYQRVYHLNSDSLKPYDAMTFPSLQKRWQTQPQRGELVGVSASAAGGLVGMTIAEVLPDRSADLLSLFVLPPYRQQKIGTGLLYRLQQALLEQDCQQVRVSYKVTPVTELALEPLLQTLGWQPPQPTFLLGKTTHDRIAQAPWLHQHVLPPDFTVFPWTELTERDHYMLQQLNVPETLSPLSDPARLEPLNSLGLRAGDRLIGWMVTHRIAPDTIRYSSLFVAPPFRARARGISLLSRAIQQQLSSSVPDYRFAVAAENGAMLRFVRRHLQPYLTEISTSRRSLWQRF